LQFGAFPQGFWLIGTLHLSARLWAPADRASNIRFAAQSLACFSFLNLLCAFRAVVMKGYMKSCLEFAIKHIESVYAYGSISCGMIKAACRRW
jgi:hypothetical protein